MKCFNLATLSLGTLLACSALSALAQAAPRSPYVIQLADAPIASYEGGIAGLAATRPAAGQKLDMASARVQTYGAYLNTRVNAVASKVPAANVYYRYGVVFNGFSALLTADELRKLRSDPAVKAITADVAMSMDTSYTTSQFLGLGQPGGAWSRKDANGKDIKGENVIIAHLDSGVWPENTSVSDKVGSNGKPVPSHEAGTVVYDPLPAGRYRGTCQVGEGFTAAMCNNKLVGAQVFQTSLLLNSPGGLWPGEYLSPRDEDGHGTHTLTTAGGNANSPVTVRGTSYEITGVAPRARLAAYKVCSSFVNASGARQNSCFTADLVAAMNKAVADGVDVINYSISGTPTSISDAVAQAMLGAAKAGVFVAAAAGNSGPANESNHNSPWVSTVGNSTHDRLLLTTVTLGNSAQISGQTAFQGNLAIGPVPLILASEAGLAGANATNLNLCYAAVDNGGVALLDPAKVAGKVVVCDRGGNARVNKSLAVLEAGGVGMIQTNTSAAQSLNADVHALPSVHLSSANRTTIRSYAAGGLGSASFSASFLASGVIAPVMSASSSRGPNRFDVNVLKPDITAPGTDILAGYTAENVSAAERAAIIAGTQVGRPGANAIGGTSMSSPHVAGAAALVKQANPTWSPSAIKSALMTSAAQTVKLDSGAADTNRWGFGSGHLTPNNALSTSLVYDISNAQYDAYFARTLRGENLNLASITFGNIVGFSSTNRRITNTSSSAVTLNAAATLAGFDVTVTPSSLTIPAGGSADYNVQVAKQAATAFNAYRFGELVWTGGGQTVRSPLTARASAVVAYSAVSDTRPVGSRIFTIGTGFAGPMVTTSSGMVAATRSSDTVLEGSETCFPLVVPAGALAARVQLFGSETIAPDLDMTVYNPAGVAVAASAGATSDEVVTLSNPAAGTYEVCVEGFTTGSQAPVAFTLSSWVVPTPVGMQTLRAAGPATAYLGGTASVVASWSTPAGVRSFGVVQYRQTAAGSVLGSTSVFVDASGDAAVTAQAPLLTRKASRQVR